MPVALDARSMRPDSAVLQISGKSSTLLLFSQACCVGGQCIACTSPQSVPVFNADDSEAYVTLDYIKVLAPQVPHMHMLAGFFGNMHIKLLLVKKPTAATPSMHVYACLTQVLIPFWSKHSLFSTVVLQLICSSSLCHRTYM